MRGHDELAERFEERRGRLRAVAYRMLGSPGEADDAVQEAWLRLGRTGGDGIDNLTAWLTTVVSRVCLDMLRSRASRREDPYGDQPPELTAVGLPEDEAVLADSVGLALLVVLDTLGPAERVAFVLHDLFAVPFDRVAAVLDRSRPAAKKLASRARHKVRGTPVVPGAELDRHREVVEAFLSAARGGDLGALLDVLAPDVVRHADPAVLLPGVAAELRVPGRSRRGPCCCGTGRASRPWPSSTGTWASWSLPGTAPARAPGAGRGRAGRRVRSGLGAR